MPQAPAPLVAVGGRPTARLAARTGFGGIAQVLLREADDVSPHTCGHWKKAI